MRISKFPLAFALALAFAAPVAAQPGQEPSLQGLHDALRLRPDQEQAWQIFLQASSPDPQEDARHRDAYQRLGSLRAPQRFDLSIQMMRADLAAMERRASALSAFYATLSPDQQAAFDRETMPPRQ